MKLPIQAQSEFLSLQIRVSEEEYKNYALSPIQNLRSEQRVHVGRVYAMDTTRGNIILRFKKDECPRLRVPYELLVYDAGKAGLSSTWRCSLFEFKRDFVNGYSEIEPIYFFDKEDPTYRYLGCMGVDAETANRISIALQKRIHPTLLLAEPPPPIEYFQNLQIFIAENQGDKLLNLSLGKDFSTWVPQPLEHDMPKASIIIETLKAKRSAIVQGPPGTGKTHLVGEIIQQYAQAGKNVVVTSLANKALMELVKNDELAALLGQCRIRKTRLTSNEAVSAKGLQNADELDCPTGSILLATYFKLSRALTNPALSRTQFQPPYDLIVIEEASQAFLATIAGFSKLAHQMLIVGDPAQLPPIVKAQDEAENIHPRIMAFAQGLETVAVNTDIPPFMLRDSYRLTDEAASLTGIFYSNNLRSHRDGSIPFHPTPLSQRYFSANGGTTILPMPTDANADQNAMAIIATMVSELLSNDNHCSLAILTPKRSTVRIFQNLLRVWSEKAASFTIETVDRVQGLTVDYCIYFLPTNGGAFALEPKRFNVATSRARCGTLIIANEFFIRHGGNSGLVKTYLSTCEVIHFDVL